MAKGIIDPLAKIATVAIMADGSADDSELEVCKDVCGDLGLEYADFEKIMKAESAKVSKMNDDEITDYIAKACKSTSKEENTTLFEAAMHILLADNELTFDECSTLAMIGEELEIPAEVMIARIAALVQEREDLVVEVDDALAEL